MIDARSGLTSAGLDALRSADQVSIGLKNRTTAVLGGWHGSGQLELVLIRATDKWGGQAATPMPLPALQITDAQHDLWWQQAIKACKRGDILVLWWWGNRLSLEVVGTTVAKQGHAAVPPRTRDRWPSGAAAHPESARYFLLNSGQSRQRRPRVGETTVVYPMMSPG